MGMKRGEKYQCPNPECGCEISVTKGTSSESAHLEPKCCCGEHMVLKERGRSVGAFETRVRTSDLESRPHRGGAMQQPEGL